MARNKLLYCYNYSKLGIWFELYVRLAQWTGGFSSFSTDFRSGLTEFVTGPALSLAVCFGSLSCRRTKSEIKLSGNGPHIWLHSSDKPGSSWQPGQIQDSKDLEPLFFASFIFGVWTFFQTLLGPVHMYFGKLQTCLFFQ